MNAILALILITSPVTYYTAKVTTFGCTSIGEVHRLKGLRSDPQAFMMALLEQQVHGHCVTILKDTLVQGSIEPSDSSILRVNREVEPPGYEAPLEDFEIKAFPGSD